MTPWWSTYAKHKDWTTQIDFVAGLEQAVRAQDERLAQSDLAKFSYAASDTCARCLAPGAGLRRFQHGGLPLCGACDEYVSTYLEGLDSPGTIRVDWWAVAGGALCAGIVFAECWFVWWVLQW